MSYDESNKQDVKQPKKRTAREFLSQYRAPGLPGAKKFRRRDRLAIAKATHEADIEFIKRLTQTSLIFYETLKAFADSSNWAIEEGDTGKFVMWLGENEEPQKLAYMAIEEFHKIVGKVQTLRESEH